MKIGKLNQNKNKNNKTPTFKITLKNEQKLIKNH
jgi:hypothetical protein